MKRCIKILSILTLSSFTLSSCGVIFGGSKFSASIIAENHTEAEIYINGDSVGTGTAVINHPRRTPLTVELKQDGCETRTQTFNNTFRTGNFVLTAITWGLIGMVIDLGTGACYKPNHKKNPSVEKLNDRNYVFTVDYSGCPGK